MSISIQKLVVSPYKLADVVLIRAVTNLHPGVGRVGEIVDLPVQKDNLGFPIIYSSSLKGALKSAFWHLSNMDSDVKIDVVKSLFGPEPEDADKFTSALAVLDALTVAFPVRSLEGVYAFATSPFLLKRLAQLLKISGKSSNLLEELSRLKIEKNVCEISVEGAEILAIKEIGNRILINEEINLECRTTNSDKIKEVEKFLGVEEGRLLLLNNDDALRAIERSLVRVTRVALDREKKIVKTGALWSEEYIPIDTIFTSLFLYSDSKTASCTLPSNEVKNRFREYLRRTNYYFIVGGDETIGVGIVRLEFKE